MAVPTDNTEWGTSVTAEIVEPSAGQKKTGWVHGTKPPAHWLNWWMRAVYRWLSYYGVKDAAGGIVGLDTNKHAEIKASGSNTSALHVEGSGEGVGVSASGGDTGSGVHGIGGSKSGSGVVGQCLGAGAGVFCESKGTGPALHLASQKEPTSKIGTGSMYVSEIGILMIWNGRQWVSVGSQTDTSPGGGAVPPNTGGQGGGQVGGQGGGQVGGPGGSASNPPAPRNGKPR